MPYIHAPLEAAISRPVSLRVVIALNRFQFSHDPQRTRVVRLRSCPDVKPRLRISDSLRELQIPRQEMVMAIKRTLLRSTPVCSATRSARSLHDRYFSTLRSCDTSNAVSLETTCASTTTASSPLAMVRSGRLRPAEVEYANSASTCHPFCCRKPPTRRQRSLCRRILPPCVLKQR